MADREPFDLDAWFAEHARKVVGENPPPLSDSQKDVLRAALILGVEKRDAA